MVLHSFSDSHFLFVLPVVSGELCSSVTVSWALHVCVMKKPWCSDLLFASDLQIESRQSRRPLSYLHCSQKQFVHSGWRSATWTGCHWGGSEVPKCRSAWCSSCRQLMKYLLLVAALSRILAWCLTCKDLCVGWERRCVLFDKTNSC